MGNGLLERETGGNVSARIRKAEVLAITPSQTPYREITPADICLLGLDLSFLVENGRKPR